MNKKLIIGVVLLILFFFSGVAYMLFKNDMFGYDLKSKETTAAPSDVASNTTTTRAARPPAAASNTTTTRAAPPEAAEEEEALPTNRKRMCLYLNSYTDCDNECGTGKQYRMQAPYIEGMDTLDQYGIHPDSFDPHVCVQNHHRPYKSCEGTLCDDTYKRSTYLEQNPGSSYAEYCQFIKDENACNNEYILTRGLCRNQCES